MDEELKKRIRIDPLKVQQKIYELYPANSAVRRSALADARAKELTHLSSMVHNEPVQLAKASIDKNKKMMLLAALLCVCLTLASAGCMTFSILLSKTLAEAVLSGLVGGYLLFHAARYLKDIIYLREVTSAFVSSMDKIQHRIDDLRK